MTLKENLSEDRFVHEFLRQELSSTRFGGEIRSILKKKGASEALITSPLFTDTVENALRAEVLGDFRGYKQNRLIFTGYPDDVAWYEAVLTRKELLQVKYVNYSYWNELSSDTRLPRVAVHNIQKGNIPYDQTDELFVQAAQAYKGGAVFPKLLLYAQSEEGPYQVLEGHLRLTAMVMEYEHVPEEIEVIVGISEKFVI